MTRITRRPWIATLTAAAVACLGSCLAIWIGVGVASGEPMRMLVGPVMGLLFWPVALFIGGVPALLAKGLIAWPILLMIRRRGPVGRAHVLLTGLATTLAVALVFGAFGDGGSFVAALTVVLPGAMLGAWAFCLFLERPTLDLRLAAD